MALDETLEYWNALRRVYKTVESASAVLKEDDEQMADDPNRAIAQCNRCADQCKNLRAVYDDAIESLEGAKILGVDPEATQVGSRLMEVWQDGSTLMTTWRSLWHELAKFIKQNGTFSALVKKTVFGDRSLENVHASILRRCEDANSTFQRIQRDDNRASSHARDARVALTQKYDHEFPNFK